MQIFKEWKSHSQPIQEAMDGVEKCPWMGAAEGSCAEGFVDSELGEQSRIYRRQRML